MIAGVNVSDCFCYWFTACEFRVRQGGDIVIVIPYVRPYVHFEQ